MKSISSGRALLAARDAAFATRLAHGFAALVALVFGLIVLGALVRAQGAGLACPDWPLCFGELVPQLDFHVAFEWGHRVVAGCVSLAFLTLSGLALARPATRQAVRGPILVAGALLALQVVLGGLTVLQLLASWTVTSHLLIGNAFAVALLVISRRLGETAAPPVVAAPVSSAARASLCAVAGLLGVQVALGGLVSSSYAGLACPDWPSCRDGLWFPGFEGSTGLQLLHRSNAYLLLAALGVAAWHTRRIPSLAAHTRLVLALGLLQTALGVANVWLRVPVEITALHSAGAAALVLTTALALRAALRAPRAARHAVVEALAEAHG